MRICKGREKNENISCVYFFFFEVFFNQNSIIMKNLFAVAATVLFLCAATIPAKAIHFIFGGGVDAVVSGPISTNIFCGKKPEICFQIIINEDGSGMFELNCNWGPPCGTYTFSNISSGDYSSHLDENGNVVLELSNSFLDSLNP